MCVAGGAGAGVDVEGDGGTITIRRGTGVWRLGLVWLWLWLRFQVLERIATRCPFGGACRLAARAETVLVRPAERVEKPIPRV